MVSKENQMFWFYLTFLFFSLNQKFYIFERKNIYKNLAILHKNEVSYLFGFLYQILKSVKRKYFTFIKLLTYK